MKKRLAGKGCCRLMLFTVQFGKFTENSDKIFCVFFSEIFKHFLYSVMNEGYILFAFFSAFFSQCNQRSSPVGRIGCSDQESFFFHIAEKFGNVCS